MRAEHGKRNDPRHGATWMRKGNPTALIDNAGMSDLRDNARGAGDALLNLMPKYNN